MQDAGDGNQESGRPNRCKFCGNRLRVTSTHHKPDKIVRYRVCENKECGNRMVSTEKKLAERGPKPVFFFNCMEPLES